jgi:hypothetical protein
MLYLLGVVAVVEVFGIRAIVMLAGATWSCAVDLGTEAKTALFVRREGEQMMVRI